MKRTVIVDIISSALLLLFLYTSISKIIEHQSFNAVLSRSPLLAAVAGFISFALPVLELIIVFLLFFPFIRIIGLYASLVLLILLTGYLIYMILFTPDLPCSCGGVLKSMTWKQHVVFNFFFIALALTGIIVARQRTFLRKNTPT